MKKRIIALTGPKGVGKTTVARALISNPNLDRPVDILSFAGPLKAMAGVLLPPAAFTPEGKEDAALGLCGVSPRIILQTLGTDWGRTLIHKDVWVEAMRRRISASSARTIIIDDLRFDNEARMVVELGGRIIALERDGVAYTREHESEYPLSPFLVDFEVDLDRVSLGHISSHAFNP
jgi:GTPase SAR1 family protein